ncbi:MAG: T9SS type A sorting domain-containing protein [Taibaiella sp.]|nr:T9SS type A sorting domain-containing protein [Taibaiella sp.]
MKKTLLSIALACFAFAQSADAQVIWSENFDGATIPALPSGVTQGSTGTPGWKSANFVAPITTGWASATGEVVPAHSTQIGVVDDWNDSVTNNLNDTLKSGIFSLAGSTEPWFNYSYFFYKATRTATGRTERAYVLGSIDGGSTWSVLDSLEPWAFQSVWFMGHVKLTSLLPSATARVAIRYTDGGDHLLGVAVDSLEVTNLNTSQAAATAVGYNSALDGVSGNGQPVAFLIQNRGITITNFVAKYTINGGAAVTQTFTPTPALSAYASASYTFTTPISGAVAGTNTVVVTITQVNSVANTEADSTETATFAYASAASQRQGLIEEFSSSTCPPCKSFNDMYDPLCLSMNVNTAGTNINVIKYQMNWPSPGTDKSYNSDGSLRRGYYGVSGIPDHFVNGRPSNTSDYSGELTGSKAAQSFVEMSITYNVDTVRKKLGVMLNVTPRFTKTGSYKVHIAVMDKYYENTTHTTGQLKYYHVMRQMLPTGSGRSISSFTDGVTQSFVDTGIAFTYGNWSAGSSTYPAQGSNKFWSNPLTGSEVIAYIQDDATKSIMQSVFSLPAGFLNVSTVAKVESISINPNPTKGAANLQFELLEEGNVHVTVMDYTGRVVSEVANKTMTAGMHNVAISTENIVPGNYIVVIGTESGNKAERLTVIK